MIDLNKLTPGRQTVKITVQGVVVYDRTDKSSIEIVVDTTGERLPPTSIMVNGGKLDVYRSDVTTSGNIQVHLFGGEEVAYQQGFEAGRAAQAAAELKSKGA